MEDVLYDSFFYCSRGDIDGCQLLNKTCKKAIAKGATELPLRRIDRVEMDCYRACGRIQIFLEPPGLGRDVDDHQADHERSIHDGDAQQTFRRLQHACIQRFSVGIHGSHFLDYWIQQKSDFVVKSIDIRLTDEPDYDYMDPIVNHLKPLSMEVRRQRVGSGDDHDNQRLQLLEREALLSNLQTIRVIVWFGSFPPTSFVLDEPGYPNYELKCCLSRSAPDAIDALLEAFKSKGCTNKKLKSLCMRWDDIDDQKSATPKLLRQPKPCNEPLPTCEMVLQGINKAYDVSACDVHSFGSMDCLKQMDVFKWVIDYDDGQYEAGSRAHIVQCRVQYI